MPFWSLEWDVSCGLRKNDFPEQADDLMHEKLGDEVTVNDFDTFENNFILFLDW